MGTESPTIPVGIRGAPGFENCGDFGFDCVFSALGSRLPIARFAGLESEIVVQCRGTLRQSRRWY